MENLIFKKSVFEFALIFAHEYDLYGVQTGKDSVSVRLQVVNLLPDIFLCPF